MHGFKLSCLLLVAALFGSVADAGELPCISTWIGNTWDGVRHAQMPLTADDIGVSGDGIVTVCTHYNEGGLNMLVLREGQPLGFGMHATATAHSVGSPDGTRLFVAVKGEYGRGVAQLTHFGELADPVQSQTRFGPLDNRDIAGLAWRGKYLYATEASDRGFNGIWVFEAARWAAKQQPAYRIDLTGKPKVDRIAVDSQGDPWVIQGQDVVHFRLENGQEIARVNLAPQVFPAALAVDHLDRVLVADRGRDCNIKLFDSVGRPAGAVGARRGFAVGPVPGLIGPLRFDKPTGLAIDAHKNLYVLNAGGSWPQTVRVEAYSWDGKTWSTRKWKAEGLIGGDAVFLDPADETRGYNSGSIFKLDWSQPPGKEWSFHATTLDTFDAQGRPTTDPRCNLGAVWWGSHGLRRIYGKRFLYAAGACDLAIYRFSKATGELAIPSVFLAARSPHHGENAPPGWPAHEPHMPDNASWIWTDSNGNGTFDKGEYQVLAHMDHSQVDEEGTILYFPMDFKREPKLRVWPVGPKLDEVGNPVYDPKAILEYPAPLGWARPRYLALDRISGDLVVTGYRNGSDDVTMSYYAGWCKEPGMAPTWSVEHLGPATRVEDSGYDTTGDHVATVQMHGPHVFVPSVLSNHVRIYRRKDGSLVGTLRHTLAPNTTLDGNLEFGIYQRRCGELILTGEDFLQNKCLVYRWMPDGPNLGFEHPRVPDGKEILRPAGASWTFEGESGLHGGSEAASAGRQAAFLRQGGWFYQALPLEKGGRYLVSFRLAGDPGQCVEVQVDNREVGRFRPGKEGYLLCETRPENTEQGGHVIKFVATGEGTARLDEVRLLPIAPPPPSNLAATAEADADRGKVMVTWQPSPRAEGYTVYRTEVAISRFAPIASHLTTNALLDEQVQADRTYLYRVVATSSAGESAGAPTVAATVPNPKGRPTPFQAGPQMVSVSGGNREVRVYWRPVEGATGYTLWRGRQAAGPMTIVAEGLDHPPYIDHGVSAGRVYWYRLSASRRAAASPLSFPASATPVDNPNLGFEIPVLPPKAQAVRPGSSGWTFAGEAGILTLESPLVAAHRMLDGRQAAFLGSDGKISRELVFSAGRHCLHFRSTQLRAANSFRVTIDGRQVGIFEPSHSPYEMLTEVFSVDAGRHMVSFEAISKTHAAGNTDAPLCLVDSIAVHEAD